MRVAAHQGAVYWSAGASRINSVCEAQSNIRHFTLLIVIINLLLMLLLVYITNRMEQRPS
jgi:hypothetical protein